MLQLIFYRWTFPLFWTSFSRTLNVIGLKVLLFAYKLLMGQLQPMPLTFFNHTSPQGRTYFVVFNLKWELLCIFLSGFIAFIRFLNLLH